MVWWIGGSIGAGLVLVLLIFFIFSFVRHSRAEAAREVKLARMGRVVKGWIVFAHEDLYKPGKSTSQAQVVFVLDDHVPQLEKALNGMAADVRNFEVADEEDWEERYIGQVVRTQIGYYSPLRLPRRIAGGLRAYTVSVTVPRQLLPEGRLTRPYLQLKVYVGAEPGDRIARAVAYSAEAEAEPSVAPDRF